MNRTLRLAAPALLAGVLAPPTAFAQVRESPFASAAASRFADSVLALMTLEEKLGQLAQAPGYGTQSGPRASAGSQAQIKAGKLGSYLGIFGADYTRELQTIAVEQTRLRIPLMFAWDIIHGHRTIYPIPLAEAASFNPDRVQQSARLAAEEATAHGMHWTFAPMVDIARDPRWGRISEGAGEDQYLGSVMAAAKVRGFQGGDSPDFSAPNTMLATAKHFAAYGAPEGGRDYNTVELSERTLWEVYMPPYEAAVRAGAATIMSSFNDIGGVAAHGSEWLLEDVLRKRWGFKGLVISDWGGIDEMRHHGVAGSKTDAGILAIRSGVDIDMATNIYADSLAAAVRAGRFSQAYVDSSAHRVLRMKYALGLFQDPYRYSDTARQRRYTLAPEHVAAARVAGREAIVLLKNDNGTLPLRKDLGSIAVIGPLADDARSALGNWAADGRREDAVSMLAGIRAALPQARVLFARGAPVDTMTSAGFAEAERAAIEADAVVFVIGEREDMSGEAASRASIELPGAQLSLVQSVSRAVGRAPGGDRKPIVAVLMNGRPLAIPELVAEVPAILETWFLGIQHGHAVADVLFGDYNPGGKLPATFPRSTGQIPLYHSHRNTGRPPVQTEKYTSKYLDVAWTPLFPFGFGLSYTTFAYGNLGIAASPATPVVTPAPAPVAITASDSAAIAARPTQAMIRAGDSVYVRVEVSNTGTRPGEEVVQIYLRDDVASVSQPVRSLKAFRRVSLAPGEKRTVSFVLAPAALALYDRAMRRVIEPGMFTVFAGTNSAAPLSTRFEVTGPAVILAPAPPRFR